MSEPVLYEWSVDEIIIDGESTICASLIDGESGGTEMIIPHLVPKKMELDEYDQLTCNGCALYEHGVSYMITNVGPDFNANCKNTHCGHTDTKLVYSDLFKGQNIIWVKIDSAKARKSIDEAYSGANRHAAQMNYYVEDAQTFIDLNRKK